MIGYEYFLDENNYILGWKQWNLKNKPELKDVPHPPAEISFAVKKDKYKRIWTGEHVFRLHDNVIIIDEYIEEDQVDKIEELEQRIAALEKK